jgi:hypothetical protein
VYTDREKPGNREKPDEHKKSLKNREITDEPKPKTGKILQLLILIEI